VPRLSDEAVRLTRWLHRLLPDDPEVAGLLALMLLTDARRPARIGPGGRLVPLAEQDRTKWNHDHIAEGLALISRVLPTGPVGFYQIQAAIAAVHDEADDTDTTDWPQILALYELLERIAPNPVVTLNKAVAVAKVTGTGPALALLAELAADQRMSAGHRLLAVRAHLHEMAGDHTAAEADFRAAAQRTTSIPERQYLLAKASGIAQVTAD
jgi:predicted RNA polymerase sigma factor